MDMLKCSFFTSDDRGYLAVLAEKRKELVTNGELDAAKLGKLVDLRVDERLFLFTRIGKTILTKEIEVLEEALKLAGTQLIPLDWEILSARLKDAELRLENTTVASFSMEDALRFREQEWQRLGLVPQKEAIPCSG